MFVVITKKAGDLNPRPQHLTDAHDEYPVECKEYSTEAEAFDQHPGCRVLSGDAYNAYKYAMNLMHGELKAPPKRAWWKFWGVK